MFLFAALYFVLFISLTRYYILCHTYLPEDGHWKAWTCRGKRWENRSYCSLCVSTYEGLDHHCIWLNQCITKTNYRCFLMILTCGTCTQLLQVILSSWSLVSIYSQDQNNDNNSNVQIALQVCSFLLVIVSSLSLTFYALTLFFHGRLYAKDETTYSWMVKQRAKQREKYRVGRKETPINVKPKSKKTETGTKREADDISNKEMFQAV